jgi:hypothetical protein
MDRRRRRRGHRGVRRAGGFRQPPLDDRYFGPDLPDVLGVGDFLGEFLRGFLRGIVRGFLRGFER